MEQLLKSTEGNDAESGLILAAKLVALKESLTEMGSVLIAFSGGVDSTFLLKVAADCLLYTSPSPRDRS